MGVSPRWAFAALVAWWLAWPFRRRVTDLQVALYVEEHEPSLQAAILSAVDAGAMHGAPAVGVPPIIMTLAMATFIYGFGRAHLIVGTDVVYLPAKFGWMASLGQGSLFGIPSPILVAAVLAIVLALFLLYLKPGRFIFAIGDNSAAARIGGIAVRPMLVLQYAISGAIAFAAGVITATSVQSMNTRVVNSNMIYDVILVVVLGGVGLSGGRGNVRNVIVGTLLIGVLMNGMTIMDIQYTVQNVIKSLILLLAIVVDSILNPRDEQTGQQGDI